MTLRIIAGQFRGRRLQVPRGAGTRPTSDRVRQALFDVLGDVENLRVLDLYAGTGALGIEALSRGAARVVFVEASHQAISCLKRNLEELALEDRSRVVRGRAESARAVLASEAPFDLVFLDPPWPKLDACLEALPLCLGPGCLSRQARVVVEHPTKETLVGLPEPLGLAVAERRTWGDTTASIFVLNSERTP